MSNYSNLANMKHDIHQAISIYVPNAFNFRILAGLKSSLPDLSKFDSTNILLITGGSLIGASLIYVGKVIYSYSYWKSRGIKTPKYKYFSGNFDEIREKTYSVALYEWTKQYGKVYGYYEGHLPILVTSDLDIIQEVFINQYNNFTARKKVPFVYDDDAPNSILVMATKNKWKRMRTIINPTFSPSKLKQLTTSVKICSERLQVIIEKHIDKEINVSGYFNNLAMDVVWNTAFGLDINCQVNTDDPFLICSKRFFDNVNQFTFPFKFFMYYYELKPIFIPVLSTISYFLGKISFKLANPFFWIMQHTKSIIEKRIQNKINRKDYVQILLDSQSESVDVEKDHEQYDPSHVVIDRKMTSTEICTNLAIFLFAGMETVSTTLSNIIYVLTKYPKEMEKLQNEIDEQFDFSLETDDEIYENINKLEYLDMFIKEVLRYYPIGNAVINRRCTNPTEIKGIKVPVDFIIAIDVLSMHNNQEYWGTVETSQFYPLRFASDYKRNKLAYMPFGVGPRFCIGMRFALLEIKLTLVKILKNYDVCPTNKDGTVAPLEYSEIAVRRPKYGVKCIFRNRK